MSVATLQLEQLSCFISYSIYLNTGHFESCHPCPYTILHRTTTKSREIKKMLVVLNWAVSAECNFLQQVRSSLRSEGLRGGRGGAIS